MRRHSGFSIGEILRAKAACGDAVAKATYAQLSSFVEASLTDARKRIIERIASLADDATASYKLTRTATLMISKSRVEMIDPGHSWKWEVSTTKMPITGRQAEWVLRSMK